MDGAHDLPQVLVLVKVDRLEEIGLSDAVLLAGDQEVVYVLHLFEGELRLVELYLARPRYHVRQSVGTEALHSYYCPICWLHVIVVINTSAGSILDISKYRNTCERSISILGGIAILRSIEYRSIIRYLGDIPYDPQYRHTILR